MNEEQINYLKSEQASTSPGLLSWQELVLARIKLLAKRRIEWLRHTWTNTTLGAGGLMSYHDEVDGYLNNVDTPFAERQWTEQTESIQPLNKALEETENQLREKETKLSELAEIFGLDETEQDLVQACIALIIDPNLGKVYAYLQDNNECRQVTAPLIARLFRHEHFFSISNTSPLLAWGLIRRKASSSDVLTWECDPVICNWLLGVTDLDPLLSTIATLLPYQDPLDNWPVTETIDFIKRTIETNQDSRIRITVSGPAGRGRKTFAAVICRHLSLLALQVNADRIPDQHWPEMYMRVQRQGFLDRTAPVWEGSAFFERHLPQQPGAFRVQFIIGEVEEKVLPAADMIDYRVELPVLSNDACLAAIKKAIPASEQWEDGKLASLINARQISIGQIKSIERKGLVYPGQLVSELRNAAATRLGNLAQPMPSSFTTQDLVLPDWLLPVLHDFTIEAKDRQAFWCNEDLSRLFPQGKGLMALFTGAPGTGKTMAAQVIANNLNMDLFRIDLSKVISKYVGETARNLDRILSRARSMEVMLLFDEADSLFGKRTEIKDAHDRYANSDTDYLLQAIEDYTGICILTSNRKMNIDTGFMRRIRYVVEFPKPDAPHRIRLWKSLLREMAGEEISVRLNKEVEQLAELLEITGAQIKLSILSALFMVRKEKTVLSSRHLLRGLERELMKEGRGLGHHIHEVFKMQLHNAN